MHAGLRVDDDAPQARFVLAEFLPFRLARAAQTVSDLVAATCETRFGLTIAAWRMLCVTAESQGLELRDLTYRAALFDPQAREAAAVLLAGGLIARTPSGRFEITEAGRDAYQELTDVALAAEAALLASLTPGEVTGLHRLLARVQGAAEKLRARPSA